MTNQHTSRRGLIKALGDGDKTTAPGIMLLLTTAAEMLFPSVWAKLSLPSLKRSTVLKISKKSYDICLKIL